jgi:hypothetical protein
VADEANVLSVQPDDTEIGHSPDGRQNLEWKGSVV